MVLVDVGLTYAILAAVLLGVYLFSIKRYAAHYPATVYVAVTYAASLVWYVPLAIVTVDGEYVPADAGTTTLAVLALVVISSVVAVLTSFRSIALGDVSYVTPIGKLIPVFVVPIEILVLGQQLTPLQVAGIAIATAAVYVANYRSGRLLDPLRRAARSRPAQLALLSAASFGVTDVGKRALTQELAVAPETVNLALFAGLPLGLAPLALRRLPDTLREDVGLFLALGLLLAAAEHLVMLAFAALPASLASPVINSSAVVAVVLGGVVLREEEMRLRLTAAGLVVLGVTLISLG